MGLLCWSCIIYYTSLLLFSFRHWPTEETQQYWDRGKRDPSILWTRQKGPNNIGGSLVLVLYHMLHVSFVGLVLTLTDRRDPAILRPRQKRPINIVNETKETHQCWDRDPWIRDPSTSKYGVATISTLLQIIGLFCKSALLKRRYSAKEINNFKEPTNRSHPIRRDHGLHRTASHCNALHRTASHCNALQRTATHCNALQRTATHCNTLHRTVSHCTALHCTALHCTTPHRTAQHCTALHRNATYCNTPQLTATYYNIDTRTYQPYIHIRLIYTHHNAL